MRLGNVLLGLVTLMSVHISSGQCSNALVGLQNGNVCCDASCGTCGGPGCADRAGGAANCCAGAIARGGMLCSDTMAPPCVIDTCYNGLQGIQTGNICCQGACGACGGRGCTDRPGGAANCCTGTIRSSGVDCSLSLPAPFLSAPCIVDNPMVCSDGTHGIEENGACCGLQCGTCGGAGCGGRPGGSDYCCTRSIQTSNIFCADTEVAPCIVTPLP